MYGWNGAEKTLENGYKFCANRGQKNPENLLSLLKDVESH